MPAWLRELNDLKARFGPEAARRKREILEAAQRRTLSSARDLMRYHEALSFIYAFPDDMTVRSLARQGLLAFVRLVAPFKDELVDSGIAGTAYHYPFGLRMVRWLLDRYGDAVDIDWDEYNEREEDNLTPLIVSTAAWPETVGLDDEGLTIEDWFDRTTETGPSRDGALRRIIRRLHASGIPQEMLETLYNGLYLPVRWDLADTDASRTLAWIDEPNPYLHGEPLRGRTNSLRSEIRTELEPLPPVSAERGRLWIDLARRALSVRDRELYPLALANEAEVYEADVGRGIRIILIGMLPDRRLAIETDYAAFLLKNGMPVGYGIGAILFDRLEIAVNIFPTYRQGESSYLFEQFARLFHHQFGCDVFLVERYQLGHENDEGLAAGSFWFYYKLGFRSIDEDVAQLADAEAKRLKKERGSRTSRALLKQLARSDVLIFLDEDRSVWPEVPLTGIGMAVTRDIDSAFQGDVKLAEATCAPEVAWLLGAGGLESWPASERRAFERLSPLIRLLPDIAEWSVDEKASLIEILRAKGKTCEAEYARLVMRHARFRGSLAALGADSTSPE
jgi:hypothetical protein